MISRVAFERWRRWPREYPLIILLLEQARWHGGSGTDSLRVGDRALHPIRFQTLFRQKEVGRRGDLVVIRITSCVTLQARSGCAREQAASHVALFGRENGHLFWNVGQRLLRQRLEEAHELSQFVI